MERLSDEIVERMVSFIKGTASRQLIDYTEADALLALIEPPVDPDVLAAGEICQAEFNERNGSPHLGRAYLTGEWDNQPTFICCLRGIKYGRSHRVPPIEQDLIDAREIAAKILENEHIGPDPRPRIFRNGDRDRSPSIQFVLRHLQDRREP